MACPGSVCCHSYTQGGREEALVSEAKREQMFHRVAFKSADCARVSFVIGALIASVLPLTLDPTRDVRFAIWDDSLKSDLRNQGFHGAVQFRVRVLDTATSGTPHRSRLTWVHR